MVIIGGFSRYLLGFESTYDKTWVDVKISNNLLLEPLKLSGRLLHIEHNDFQSSVKDRWIWKSPERFVLDIFIEDTNRDFIVKDGLNLQHPKEAIQFFKEYLSEMGENEYIQSKISKLEKYI